METSLFPRTEEALGRLIAVLLHLDRGGGRIKKVQPSDPLQTVPFRRQSVSSSRGWRWQDWWALLSLSLLALALRLYRITEPAKQYFDEIYYVDAAKKLMNGQMDPNSVHPPLGKWMIAGGMKLSQLIWGPDVNAMLSWRLASVVVGVLMVGITYHFALLLFDYNRVAAFAAGVFIATEHLHLSTTRIAMLDPFLAFFCLLGTYWSFRYFLGGHERYALLGALTLGLATGCKWSGLFTAFGCFCCCLFLQRHHCFEANEDLSRTQRYFFWLLLLVPLGFLLSYAHLFWAKGLSFGTLETLFDQGERMVRFRYDEKQFVHAYKSQLWEWPLVLRPIWFFFEQNKQAATVTGICALGVWSTWWIFTVLLVERFYSGVVTRRDTGAGALVILWFCQWIPWVVSTTGGFFYYMLPQVPLMALLMGKWFADLFNYEDALAEGRWRGMVLALLVLGGFLIYYPFACGMVVSRAYFDAVFFLPEWV